MQTCMHTYITHSSTTCSSDYTAVPPLSSPTYLHIHMQIKTFTIRCVHMYTCTSFHHFFFSPINTPILPLSTPTHTHISICTNIHTCTYKYICMYQPTNIHKYIYIYTLKKALYPSHDATLCHITCTRQCQDFS